MPNRLAHFAIEAAASGQRQARLSHRRPTDIPAQSLQVPPYALADSPDEPRQLGACWRLDPNEAMTAARSEPWTA